jgi:hypothetical protein
MKLGVKGFFVAAFMFASSVVAQAGEIQEKLEYDALSVKKAIETALSKNSTGVESGKLNQLEDGTYKGKLQSFIKVIFSGEDGVLDTLKSYSTEESVPFIRGGIWVAARVQYVFYLTENDDETTNLRVKCDVSGYEKYITDLPHSTVSNGKLEQQIMADIKSIYIRS